MDYEFVNELIKKRIFEGEAFENNNLQFKMWYKEEFNYFCEFFDTSKLTYEEAYDFIFNKDEEHKNYRDLFFKKLEKNDDSKEFFREIVNLDKSNGYNLFKDKYEKGFYSLKLLRNIVKGILWLSFVDPFIMRISNGFSSFFIKEPLMKLLSIEDKEIYYRGQADYSWGLKSTMLRDYSCLKYDGCVIDKKVLFNNYKKTGLIQKYNETVCDDKKINNENDINYEFLSFMQHSVSYSPLIDFTSDVEVAYKFALNKSNPNTYLFKDSSLFILEANDSQVNYDKIEQINIKYLSKPIEPGKTMKIKKSNGKFEILDFKTIPEIKNKLKPKFVILKEMTNDRMKYQKGKFVLFYDYISVKGNIYYLSNNDFIIFKRKILKAEKNKIVKRCSKSRRLDYSYLMNPYLYFND